MGFNEKQRVLKNKSKARKHEKRDVGEKDLLLSVQSSRKRGMQEVKNYKRKNSIEKNPWINELRGKVMSEDDWDVLNEYYYGEE